MSTLSVSGKIRAVFDSNPGRFLTAKEIATILDLEATQVSTVLSVIFSSKSNWLERKHQTQITTTNGKSRHKTVYAYALAMPESLKQETTDLFSANEPAKVPTSSAPTKELLNQTLLSVETQLQKTFESIILTAFDNAAKSVIPELEKRLQSIVNAVLIPISGQQTAPAIEKERKPKVLIAGLINSQIQIIEKKFKDHFDLRYWRSEQSLKQLKSSIKSMDVILGFTGKLNHSADEIMAQSDKYIRISGGMSSLEEELVKMYVEISETK
jgi:hypothetical protein